MDKNYLKLIDEMYYRVLCTGSSDNLLEIIYRQNDRYLKVSSSPNFWDILTINNIEYEYGQKQLRIISNNSKWNLPIGCLITNINGMDPLLALSTIREGACWINYRINEEMFCLMTSYPTLKNVTQTGNYVLTEEDLFIFNINFNNIKFDNFHSVLAKACYENVYIDLRDNQGGSTLNCLRLLEYFVPYNEDIVYLKNKNQVYSIKSKSREKVCFNRIFFFVNENTKSSAELFIKSIYKFHVNITLIGNDTGGKDIITKTTRIGKWYVKIPTYQFFFDFPSLDRNSEIIIKQINKNSFRSLTIRKENINK